MPLHPSSSAFSHWLGQLQNYLWSLSQQGGAKKLVTAFAVLLGMVWMYKRLEMARAQERRLQTLRDARGNLLPRNIALNQHAPSPPPAASASTESGEDVRLLPPAQRYLSEKGARVRRQTVCLTITPSNGLVLQRDAAGQLLLRDEAVPLLLSLAQFTQLYLVSIEADKQKQEEIMAALGAIGLFDSGLKKHRVLFCSTSKGKGAILRHLEPNLWIDEDRPLLASLRPFLDQVVHVQTKGKEEAQVQRNNSEATSSNAASGAAVPSFASLSEFFFPADPSANAQLPASS